jgi:fumarate hydratase class II
MSTRVERDSLGTVEVPDERYWGAQTQRSLEHFDIGRPAFVWGRPIIAALGLLKATAAEVNAELGELDLDSDALAALVGAAREVQEGRLDSEFPLVVFQTGSGTQTNMNANEVIAGRANELTGHGRGGRDPVHPNDHVNRGQSSNDVIPSVVHLAVVDRIEHALYPALDRLRDTLGDAAVRFEPIVMVGRTHLQDAAPIRLGHAVGSWVTQLDHAMAGLRRALLPIYGLAIGGTAVGTGLNAHPEFGARVAQRLAEQTGMPFHQAEDLPAALASRDDLVTLSGALRTVAIALYKIANDVRWLASGPRAGLGELRIPSNEPGSSIMPGKVNPTQAEALRMVVARVVGNDATVAFAGAQGAFQLHVDTPVIAHALLESIDLLADGVASFDTHCARGLEADEGRIATHVAQDLMLVTALAPHLGYDQAAAIAHRALTDDLSLREAAIASGSLTGAEFDGWVDPAAMAGPLRGARASGLPDD